MRAASLEPSLAVCALRHAARDPDRLAAVDGASDEQFTRAELAGRSAALAAGLSERGIGRGDLVAVAMPNSAWWPVVAVGVWRAGAALAPVSPLWTALEMGRVLSRVRPGIAVAFGELVPVMRGALSAARLPISVLVHDVAPETTPCTPLARLLASTDADPLAEPELQPSNLAAVLLPSGTGGPAKSIRLTHGDLTAAATQACTYLAAGAKFGDSPFLHPLRLIGSLCAPLYAGAQIVVSPTRHSDRALEPIDAAPAELA